MAVGHEQRNRQAVLDPQAREQLDERQKRELERLEEGQEISAQQAEALQPQIGNAALSSLLQRAAGQAQAAAGGGQEAEHEEIVETQEEEELAETELDGPQFGGGGGGAGGPGGPRDPWDLGHLFGGDDDAPADDGGGGQPRLRASPIRALSDPEDELPPEDEDEEGDPKEFLGPHLQAVEGLPGAAHDHGAPAGSGDARFTCPALALGDPVELAALQLGAERLLDLPPGPHPLGHPLAMARFLASSATGPLARALARAASLGAAVLMPEEGGGLGAAARLASVGATLQAIEAEESGASAEVVDRACRLARVDGAWPLAVQTARDLAQRRRLRAPQIAELALDGGLSLEEERGAGELSAETLGGRALSALLPARLPLVIPPLARPQPPPLPEDDETAAIDALLAEWTGGPDPRDLPDDPVLEAEALEPVLKAASDLVNAMGRAQVELAAAAIAARQVHPRAPVRQILVHGDRALRLLARDAVQAGDALAELRGIPATSADALCAPHLATLRRSAEGLDALLGWAMEALAAAAVGPEERSPPWPPLPEALRRALALREGGDPDSAKAALEEARSSGEPGARLLAGCLALERGQRAAAARLLAGLAESAFPEPVLLFVRTVRLSLAQAAGDADAVGAEIEQIRRLARLRAHPLALADAALADAWRAEVQGEDPLDALLTSLVELGAMAQPGALNLVKARLIQLRAAMSAEVFDERVEAVLRRRGLDAPALGVPAPAEAPESAGSSHTLSSGTTRARSPSGSSTPQGGEASRVSKG